MTEHIPVMLQEILEYLPSKEAGRYLDLTLGAGGHLRAVLEAQSRWTASAWDQDPRALARVKDSFSENLLSRLSLRLDNFSNLKDSPLEQFDYALADLGVSSFQFDPEQSGMSLHSERALDFRMNPEAGEDFSAWLKKQSVSKLEDIFYAYGEEPKARKLAEALVKAGGEATATGKSFANFVSRVLAYKDSKRHPATKIFQALRIVINDELGALDRMLSALAERMAPGGRIAIISFHSLEDRVVKKKWLSLEQTGNFVILTKRPRVPSESEISSNPRSRSAKLRVLERVG
jgi:16S rRNA (cytosine1402-N4)-methyltransferase